MGIMHSPQNGAQNGGCPFNFPSNRPNKWHPTNTSPHGHGSKSRTLSEDPNPHQNRLKWVVHLPQNGTIGFDPPPTFKKQKRNPQPGLHGAQLVVDPRLLAHGLLQHRRAPRHRSRRRMASTVLSQNRWLWVEKRYPKRNPGKSNE